MTSKNSVVYFIKILILVFPLACTTQEKDSLRLKNDTAIIEFVEQNPKKYYCKIYNDTVYVHFLADPSGYCEIEKMLELSNGTLIPCLTDSSYVYCDKKIVNGGAIKVILDEKYNVVKLYYLQ